MIPELEEQMGLFDKIYENAGFAIAQHIHNAEIDALKATIVQKDATIETQEKHIDLMKAEAEKAKSTGANIEEGVNHLRDFAEGLEIDHPIPEALIEETTATAALVSSSTTQMRKYLNYIIKIPDEDDDPDIGPISGDLK